MIALTLGIFSGVQILDVIGEVLHAYLPRFQRGGFEPPLAACSVKLTVLLHQFLD